MKTILIEASPWNPLTGAVVSTALAGGGRKAYRHRSRNDWIAGVIGAPKFSAAVDFDENGFAGGARPEFGVVEFAPSSGARLAAVAGLLWIGAAIEVFVGDDELAVPVWSTLIKGTVESAAVRKGRLLLKVRDISGELDRPVASDRFTGGGGIEGDSFVAERLKRRAFGHLSNVEALPLKAATNIYELADPAIGLAAIYDVKDMGRSASSLVTVAWAGSVAATLTALEAASAPSGGGAIAPSIACLKWWTQPVGPLTADICGPLGPGGSAAAPRLAESILASRTALTITNAATAAGWRGADAGLYVDNPSETIAQALDRLLKGASLAWNANADGTIRLTEFSFSSPVETVTASEVVRTRSFKPLLRRRVGFLRNHRLHNESEISSALRDDAGALLTAGATFGSTVYKVGGAVAPQAEFETIVGTAAAITGQSAWATYGTLPPTRLEGLTNGSPVTIYKRSITTPALPSSSSTFTFATGVLTGLTNGWATAIPASDGNPLWISQAPAIGTGTTATIAAGSWSAARALADDKVKTFYEAGSTIPTPVKDWDFTSALPAGFTITRTGTATRVNSSGYIEDVAAGNPRFDHDSVTLAAKGLLFETGRTNSFPFSEALASSMTTLAAAWTSDTQTSPKNATTAETLTASAGLNRHIAYLSLTGTAATYAASMFFKQGAARYVQLQFSDDGTSKRYGVILDTQTGTVTDTNSINSPAGTSYRVEAFKNGWFRLSITMTLSAASCYLVMAISNSATPSYDAFGNPSFTAAGTETIHAWGGQIEIGDFATSYIPNLSNSTTSRGNEFADMTGTDFSSWFTSSQGAFFVEAESYKPSYNASALFAFQGSGTDASGILVAMHDLEQVILFNSSGGIAASLDHGSTAALTYYKYAFAWANNDFASSRDGGAVLTDTSGTYGNTAATLRFGMYRDNQYPLNGHVKRAKFWNTRLANANLETLSGGGAGGSAPTAAGVGDIWYNLSEGNKQYRWSGAAWEPVQDDAIGVAQATADGKNKVFPASAAAPTGAVAGDLWPDTSSSPAIIRRLSSGATWDAVATYGAKAGSTIYRTDGTTVLTQAEIRTLEGIASAITGQGALATLSSVNTGQITADAVTAPYLVSTGVQTLTASSGFGQTITGLSFTATIPSGDFLDVDLLTFPLWSGNDGTRFSLDARLMRDGVSVASFGQVMDTNDIATNNQGGFAVPVGLFARVAGNGASSTYSVELQLNASLSESNSGGSKTFVAPLDIRLRSSQLRARRYSR